MKNYGGRGGCTASADNTLRDFHKSSYDTKAKFNNCFNYSFKVIPSLKNKAKTCLPPSMLSLPSIVHI